MFYADLFAVQIESEEFELVYLVVETLAMVGRETKFAHRQAVFASGVALVLCPAIHRVLLGKSQHVVIAKSLCQDRCRGDIGILAIALYDALKRQF